LPTSAKKPCTRRDTRYGLPTSSLTAQQVQALIDSGKPAVIVDARRFDEFHTMSIPTATSMPGAELVLRIRELAPDPATPVVVNCAGRTRSIIGTQSLINAGLPNPVAALRNGTIGWTLAGQQLDHGATRTAPHTVAESHHSLALTGALTIGQRAGVRFIRTNHLPSLDRADRTTAWRSRAGTPWPWPSAATRYQPWRCR
jgi:rhodanese-related sulfurtransferase